MAPKLERLLADQTKDHIVIQYYGFVRGRKAPMGAQEHKSREVQRAACRSAAGLRSGPTTGDRLRRV